MNSDERCDLKSELNTYLVKYPDASTKDLMTWIYSGHTVPRLNTIRRKTVHEFVFQQKAKFDLRGSLAHLGGNWRKKISQDTKRKVKRLAENKEKDL